MQWVSDALSNLISEYPNPSQPTPGQLQHHGMLSKAQLQQFFEAGNDMLSSSDVLAELKEAHTLGKDVEELITEHQKKLFIAQGVDGDFGIHCLGRVDAVYRDDQELMSQFFGFVRREEAVVDEVELPPVVWKQKEHMRQLAETQKQVLAQQIANLTPEQQVQFWQKQEQYAERMQELHQQWMNKMVSMTPQEKITFMESQVEAAAAMQQQPIGKPAGSSMSPEQQAAFFQATFHAG